MPTEDFDPYYKWLGIPPEEQPPHHYRLLGIRALEADADVIAHAADRQMAHVRTFQTGPHAEHSQRLLNEISAARLCLHVPETKAEYDSALAARLQASLVGTPAAAAERVALLPPLLTGAASLEAAAPRGDDGAPDVLPRPAWGWKAIATALCVGLAAVAIAWKIRLDRRAADDAGDDEPISSLDAPDGASQPRQPTRPGDRSNEGGSSTTTRSANPKVELPELPELPGAVDLLAAVDVAQHAVQGEWHREGTVLVSPAGKDPSYAILMLPGDVPAEYTLALLVERVEGRDALAINFPSGEHRGVVVLDSTVGGLFADSPVSGLDRIDGRQYYQNETKRVGGLFPRRKVYAVLCEVRKEGVRVTVDGKEILAWQGEPNRLSVGRQWQAKDAQGKIAQGIVLGSYRSAWRFSKVVVAPLNDG